jgi:hypothetical protein
MPMRVGTEVIDRRCGQRAIVRGVVQVPRTRDLFGRLIPAHRRYVLAYDDGRWADSRYDDDLAAPSPSADR